MSRLLIASFLTGVCLSMAGCYETGLRQYLATAGEPVTIHLPAISTKGVSVESITWDDTTYGHLIQEGASLTYVPESRQSATEVIPLTIHYTDQSSENGLLIVQVAPSPQPLITESVSALRMKGSHNSYHMQPSLLFHNSHAYSHPPLYEQLELDDVRVLELDIHQNPWTNRFETYHIAAIDPVSRCYRFDTCLDDLLLWSDHNPNHAPVFVWLEIKDFTGGQRIEDLSELATQIQNRMGSRLYTPLDLQAGYNSIQERLQAMQGWPEVAELQGRFVFIVLNPENYVTDDASAALMNQTGLFPRAYPDQFAASWAAITKLSVGDEALDAAHQQHLLIAANACLTPIDADECQQELELAQAQGIHMIKTDDTSLPLATE
jgi:hypothetical protein